MRGNSFEPEVFRGVVAANDAGLFASNESDLLSSKTFDFAKSTKALKFSLVPRFAMCCPNLKGAPDEDWHASESFDQISAFLSL